MKKLTVILSLVLIAVALTLTGCTYDEGDELAETTWEKMTIKEKSYYDKVDSKWSQARTKYIRAAVRGRKVKPDETAIPFIDIAELIIAANDLHMETSSGWDTDTKKAYAAAKWDAIDKDWYRKILIAAGKEIEPVKKIGAKPFFLKPRPKKEATAAEPSYAESNDGVNYLLPIEEYDRLKWEIKKCPQARELLNEIVARGKPLTIADKDALLIEVLMCKTKELQESMSD